MQTVGVVTPNGELVLLPRNRTLFRCDHGTVLHMPHAETGPYKLLTFLDSEPHIYSYDLRAVLRYVVLFRRVRVCSCLREWAMAGEREARGRG